MSVKRNNNNTLNRSQPEIVISEEEKLIIKRQWKILSADMKGTGTAVFMKIFKDHPEVKQEFSYRDIDDNSLPSSAELRCHAFRFMQAVGATIENIDDLENKMSDALLTLGKQHVNFTGFKPIYIQTFYNAILKVWQESLGIRYTTESANAWSRLLRYVMEKLEKGYHIAVKEETITAEVSKPY